MLLDTRQERPENKEGFNPNVQNEVINAVAAQSQKTSFWILVVLGSLTVIGFFIFLYIWFVSWPNKFNSQQLKINNSASSIELNLAKRKDTLIKLFEQTKAYLKFENDTYTKVAELRSGKTTKNNINESNKEQILMNSIARDINIAYEQYPNLKANSIIVDLISASQYIENEIAASRRLYNMDVTQFNQSIMLYPAVVKAKKMKLYTLPLFVASEEQKKGVDMSGLSDFNK